jgi:hypothetical protein
MNREEKSQLTGWIVIGAIVAVMVVGVFYVNRNPADNLSDIAPAAGDYRTGNMTDDNAYEPPAQPAQPLPRAPE